MFRLQRLARWLLGLDHRRLLETLDWPIRVNVPLVVVYHGPESLNYLPVGLGAAAAAKDFFRRTCNIELQVTVSARAIAKWAPGPEYAQTVLVEHRYRHGGATFLVLIRSDEARLSGGRFLGQAFAGTGGFCVVAGNHPPPSLVNETAIHELGHLFGLDHEDQTFMAAVLEVDERIVTKAQRAKARQTAYQYGSL